MWKLLGLLEKKYLVEINGFNWDIQSFWKSTNASRIIEMDFIG